MPTLGDIPSLPLATVRPHEPLQHAAEAMTLADTGSVCVLGSQGELLGIFTERDLVRACGRGIDTASATVAHWMTSDPLTADVTDDADAALRLMLEQGFRHLPVLGNGSVLAVASVRRLSKALHAMPDRS